MADAARPPVAAVVLNWNGIADTRRCLASLLGPGGPETVTVVDNGSRYGEGETLRKEYAADGRVEVLLLPRNLGFAGGVNAGVRAARTRGASDLLLLNNDAVLEAGALETLRAALAADPGAAAAGPRILVDDGSGRTWFGGGRIVRGLGVAVHEGAGRAAPAGGGVRSCGFLTFCAVLVRGGDWDAVGILDEEYFAYWEDADWCARAAASGRRLLHCEGAVARHRVSAAAGHRSPFQAYLLARGHVLFARKRLGGAARAFCFWPWMLGLRAPHVFLRNLLTGRRKAAFAFLRGLRDGRRGGPPLPPGEETECGFLRAPGGLP